MPKLNVVFCIVCEEIRQEINGKFSVLGFYGLLPNVYIKVSQLEGAIARLLFLIDIEGDVGKYQFDFEIIDPEEKSIQKLLLAEMQLYNQQKERTVAAINLAGLPISKTAGDYTVKLSYKDEVFYESKFAVELGEANLFTVPIA